MINADGNYAHVKEYEYLWKESAVNIELNVHSFTPV